MEFLAFPWKQLGDGLRILSLSGTVGDVAAWLLYLIVGSIPLVGWLVLYRRRGWHRIDILLPIMALSLFGGMWLLINPDYLQAYVLPEVLGKDMACAVVAVLLDSLLITWAVLSLVGYVETMNRSGTFQWLRWLLLFYMVVVSVSLIWQGGSELVTAQRALRESNTMLTGALMPSLCFLTLQYLVEYLPAILHLVMLIPVFCLLGSAGNGLFSEEVGIQVQKIYQWSKRVLAVILFSQMIINLLQLLFARKLLDTHFHVTLPLDEIVKVLALLLLSRFYIESRRIKEENEMFI